METLRFNRGTRAIGGLFCPYKMDCEDAKRNFPNGSAHYYGVGYRSLDDARKAHEADRTGQPLPTGGFLIDKGTGARIVTDNGNSE